MHILRFDAPIANRRADRRAAWCSCVPKLNMHVLRIYVYMDAPIILGVLYIYECMHVCMYYVFMYVCAPIGAPFGAPIANRRADRRVVCCRCTNKYVRIENVCIIYRRADYTGSTIYV